MGGLKHPLKDCWQGYFGHETTHQWFLPVCFAAFAADAGGFAQRSLWSRNVAARSCMARKAGWSEKDGEGSPQNRPKQTKKNNTGFLRGGKSFLGEVLTQKTKGL